MITNPEVTSYVSRVFYDQETRNKNTNARKIASALSGTLDPTFTRPLERSLLRSPTESHVYEGAKETLQSLLDTGSFVSIWTQGDPQTQRWKVATSGLTDVRKTLPVEERKRFGVYTAEDKIADLPSVLQSLQETGVRKVYIVDDKSENIVGVNEVSTRFNEGRENPLEVVPIWINQGRTKDKVPQGYSLDSFTQSYTTVEDIRELSQIQDTLGAGTAWLIDFDYTLINTADAKNTAIQRVANFIAQNPEAIAHRPVLSPIIDYNLGLNGNVRDVVAFTSGMSEGKVVRVTTDQDNMVIKYNQRYPEKLENEIRGYQRLHRTLLAGHMLLPTHASVDEGLLVLPYFDGVQMREGIKDGSLDEETAYRVFSQLLTAKKQWWAKQEKVFPNGDLVSMQRKEWDDTSRRVTDSVAYLASHFGMSEEDIWLKPVTHQGRQYPPLIVIMGRVADALKKRPPYAVLAHGDATGANILVDSKTNDWKIIDAEWAGYADPAEAYVRMIKYVSTTTAQIHDEGSITAPNSHIEVDQQVKIPDTAAMLQAQGIKMAQAFGTSLHDSDFPIRVKEYLAGSYIRELALAEKRGYPEMGIFAMIKAAEALSATV